MAVKVVKQGEEFCVVEPDGSTVKGGCHETKQEAQDHAAAINANTEKERKSFVPFGVTSFSELDAVQESVQTAQKVQELTWNFNDLVWNILDSDEVQDKGTAVRQLASEFVDRLDEASSMDDTKEADIERLNKHLDNNFVDKLMKMLGRERPKSDLLIFKDQSGVNRWVGRYSNSYRDNDRPPEIISEKSHQKFVAMVDAGLAPPPGLWLWHLPQLQIGQSDWVAYDDSGFAIAGGHFYPGTEEFVDELKQLDDVRMSHGMPKWSISRDNADKSIITEHVTEEISLLPGWAAANKRTGFVILDDQDALKEETMAIPEQKRDELAEWGISPDLIDALERLNTEEAAAADKAGVERKSETPADEVEEVVDETATDATEEEPTEPDAQTVQLDVNVPELAGVAQALEDTMKNMVLISERLKSLEGEVKELRETDEVKVAAKAANTPLASVRELMNLSVIGNDDARIDGRTKLAKASPKETAPETEHRTGIPFIDAMITNSDRRDV